MSTSETARDRVVILEAAAAAALLTAVVALASPDDVWLRDAGIHPMWLPIIVLSARYAIRGLFPVLAFTCGGLIAAGVLLEDSIAGFAVRTRSEADLLALATAVLVAWVAMLHENRIARLARRFDDATEARQQAEDSVHALHSSLEYLRNRHDRLDLSLSLWRNLAARLERGDAADAARAVLELCEIRAGAHVGTVQLWDGDRTTPLACRGAWSPTSSRPPVLDADATVRAAIRSRRVTPAVPGATESDSDVAVPMIDDDGVVIGVIALRGVQPSRMRAADLRDLGVLAAWLASAVARPARRQLAAATTGDIPIAHRRKTEVSS
jgi:hypothetical protein